MNIGLGRDEWQSDHYKPAPVDHACTVYAALIWSTKISLYRPTGGYLCYFNFTH